MAPSSAESDQPGRFAVGPEPKLGLPGRMVGNIVVSVAANERGEPSEVAAALQQRISLARDASLLKDLESEHRARARFALRRAAPSV